MGHVHLRLAGRPSWQEVAGRLARDDVARCGFSLEGRVFVPYRALASLLVAYIIALIIFAIWPASAASSGWRLVLGLAPSRP